MQLIDVALTREQFEAFDPGVVAQLCEAAQSDLHEWGLRLLDAWENHDLDGVPRSRHALAGVCGIFGASALIGQASEPLIEPDTRSMFSACIEATIAAIWAVANVRRAGADMV